MLTADKQPSVDLSLSVLPLLILQRSTCLLEAARVGTVKR